MAWGRRLQRLPWALLRRPPTLRQAPGGQTPLRAARTRLPRLLPLALALALLAPHLTGPARADHTGGARYEADFERGEGGEWVDVLEDGHLHPWLYPGDWQTVEAPAPGGTGTSQVYQQTVQRPQPALTFRRYAGDAFGPDGRLPDYYRAEVDARPLASDFFKPPVGDLGVQVYYLDPTHYVEVNLTPDQVEVWQADGAEPGSSRNWTLLWSRPQRFQQGRWYRVGAVVDVVNGTLDVYLDGAFVQRVQAPVIRPAPHWFTLRAAGQAVQYDNVVIQDLGVAPLLLDDDGAQYQGHWEPSSATPGFHGQGYHHAPAGSGALTATWGLQVPRSGAYRVLARWSGGDNRARNAPYTVRHAQGETTVRVDQRQGGRWASLGVFLFEAGAAYTVTLSNDADGVVIADALNVVATHDPVRIENGMAWEDGVPGAVTPGPTPGGPQPSPSHSCKR